MNSQFAADLLRAASTMREPITFLLALLLFSLLIFLYPGCSQDAPTAPPATDFVGALYKSDPVQIGSDAGEHPETVLLIDLDNNPENGFQVWIGGAENYAFDHSRVVWWQSQRDGVTLASGIATVRIDTIPPPRGNPRGDDFEDSP